jgi:uridine phosphorylase
MAENYQYHIACGKGDIGGYCLLPGDPDRAEEIARYLKNPIKVAANREFVTYNGELLGQKVTVTSTGIGGPSAAIALEELAKLGAHTVIRVGTCGGIASFVLGGDIVIAAAACRQEGTSREYAPIEYPAVADHNIVAALQAAAKEQELRRHTGVVQSKDSFYGQHEPERMPVAEELAAKWRSWQRLNVLASEMETAALFVAAASLNIRAGAVLQVLWNKDRREGLPEQTAGGMEPVIRVAVNALIKIMEDDNI